MTASADRLAQILDATLPRLTAMSDAEASQPRAHGRWSKKEILGHLIDSASNNHQRFVRGQLAPALELPSYEQESWVTAQSYSTESWADLTNLWLLYNRHMVHIIRNVPHGALATPCAIGGSAPVPLSEVISSYVEHLQHHLRQILG
jgi:DinB superfamily